MYPKNRSCSKTNQDMKCPQIQSHHFVCRKSIRSKLYVHCLSTSSTSCSLSRPLFSKSFDEICLCSCINMFMLVYKCYVCERTLEMSVFSVSDSSQKNGKNNLLVERNGKAFSTVYDSLTIYTSIYIYTI